MSRNVWCSLLNELRVILVPPIKRAMRMRPRGCGVSDGEQFLVNVFFDEVKKTHSVLVHSDARNSSLGGLIHMN